MYQRLIKSGIATIFFIIFFTGCASVSVSTYQDGSSLGKGKIRIGAGAEMSPMMNYGLEGADPENPENFKAFELFEEEELEEGQDSTMYYWGVVNLLMQYGLTDKIDIGLIPFTDFYFNYGTKGFAKYAFMDEDSKMQIAVVPYYGYGRFQVTDSSATPGQEWDAEVSQFNTTYYGVDIPISFPNPGLYFTLKMYTDILNGSFTYFDQPGIEHTPSQDPRTSYGIAFGADTPGEYGRIELQVMFQKTPKDEWLPRAYIGYNKFFDLN
tara:strand:- start:1250 stop:2050 length:801 start_codon:yes stop_codon:yes gene_type:complete